MGQLVSRIVQLVPFRPIWQPLPYTDGFRLLVSGFLY